MKSLQKLLAKAGYELVKEDGTALTKHDAISVKALIAGWLADDNVVKLFKEGSK
jgi:hypothetical protein